MLYHWATHPLLYESQGNASLCEKRVKLLCVFIYSVSKIESKKWKNAKAEKHNCDGIRTRNPWIRSPVRYPIAPHSQLSLVSKNVFSRWRDSNSRPPAYKAGAITTMLHRQIFIHTQTHISRIVRARFSFAKKIIMLEVGFEPTHPKIIELKSTALDRSAIQAHILRQQRDSNPRG